jgi:SWI/SNF-related matrix-associated actin-dependent regulator of chromatin subfamily A-like protein 1
VRPPLYNFQADAIDRMVAAPRAICLAAEMGLGKTRMAIEGALRVGAQRVLVIAPKIACVVWPVEVERWAPTAQAVLLRPSQAVPRTGTVFAVINYEALPAKTDWILAWVAQWRPDLVILDEAHYLKSHDAKRTKIIYGPRWDGGGGIIQDVKRVWLMSGTPAPNFTSELWTHLHALKPRAIWNANRDRAMNLWEFRRVYSAIQVTQWGERVVGSKNTAALRQACDGFFHRIRTADVLTDLPPIVWSTEPVDAELPAEGVPRILAEALHLGGEDLLDWLRHNEAALSSARRILGMAKVRGAADWIEYFLENNPERSLVVFAHHRDVLSGLAELLHKHQPLLVHGGTSLGQRVTAVQEFQAKKRRLWLGQMQASGTAITLTAASDVLFVELDWTPATVAQAAARTHRIGQGKTVMARALYVPETLDRAISEILFKKAREIRLMFDHNEKEATA